MAWVCGARDYGQINTKTMNKEQIVKILENYVFDNVGETRPYIDPESINDIATEIVSSSNVIHDVVNCDHVWQEVMYGSTSAMWKCAKCGKIK